MNKHPFKIDRTGLIGFTQNLIQTPSLSMQEEDAASWWQERCERSVLMRLPLIPSIM